MFLKDQDSESHYGWRLPHSQTKLDNKKCFRKTLFIYVTKKYIFWLHDFIVYTVNIVKREITIMT